MGAVYRQICRSRFIFIGYDDFIGVDQAARMQAHREGCDAPHEQHGCSALRSQPCRF
jgi:hypothetical protein